MSAFDSVSRSLNRAVFVLCVFVQLAWITDWSDLFVDFRSLWIGGSFYSELNGQAGYDTELFAERLSEQLGVEITSIGINPFLSTPPFGWFMAPFGLLPETPASWLWVGLSVASLVISLRLLKLPYWMLLPILLMPFSVRNFALGQTGMFVLLVVAALHHFSTKPDFHKAGAIAGLGIFKPTFLFGYALWWMTSLKRWRIAIVAAVVSAVAISIPTLIWPEDWLGFFDAYTTRTTSFDGLTFNSPTVREAVARITSNQTASSPIVTLSIFCLGGATMFALSKRWQGDLVALSGAAAFVSLLVAPHLVSYDSGIILIPFAVAYHRGIDRAQLERWTTLFLIAGITYYINTAAINAIERWTSPLTVVTVALFAMWATEMDRNQRVVPAENV